MTSVVFGKNLNSQTPTVKIKDFSQLLILKMRLNCFLVAKLLEIFKKLQMFFNNEDFLNIWEQYHSLTATKSKKYIHFSCALFMQILKTYLTLFLAAKLLEILHEH